MARRRRPLAVAPYAALSAAAALRIRARPASRIRAPPLEDLRLETRLAYQLSQCTIWSRGMRSAGLNSSPVKYPTVINAVCV